MFIQTLFKKKNQRKLNVFKQAKHIFTSGQTMYIVSQRKSYVPFNDFFLQCVCNHNLMKPDREHRIYSKPILRSFSSLARTLARFRVYMNIVWVYYVSVSLARLKAYCLYENIFGVVYRYTDILLLQLL